jgi:dTDP-4-dehydrorhamnose reductase
MSDAKTLILGSSGFLGGYFCEEYGESAVRHTTKIESEAQGGADLLIANLHTREDVKRLLSRAEFSKVINCVALSDIDNCERDPQKANWLNAELPKVLAEECSSTGTQLVHISTDAVFAGIDSFSSETSQPNPKSVYGLTKYKGETAVIEENPNSLVCRVNFVGWNLRGKSLFNFFYSSIRDGKKVKGFHDIYFTPMYARDTVKIISKLSSAKQAGLFHIVGNERISKFEFGQQVARAMEADPNLVEKSSFLDSSIAKTRTADLSLSNVKIKDLGMQIPTILSGIEALVKEADNYHA